MSLVQINVSDLSELDFFELQAELDAQGVPASNLSVKRSAALPDGSFGDPALVAALISVTPQITIAIAAGVAVWIAKRKVRKGKGMMRLKISKDGIEFASVSSNEYEEGDGGAALKAALGKMLDSATGN